MMGKSERDRQMMGKSERQASDGEEPERQRDRQVIENSERDKRASDGASDGPWCASATSTSKRDMGDS